MLMIVRVVGPRCIRREVQFISSGKETENARIVGAGIPVKPDARHEVIRIRSGHRSQSKAGLLLFAAKIRSFVSFK